MARDKMAEASEDDQEVFLGPSSFFDAIPALNKRNPSALSRYDEDISRSMDQEYFVPFMNQMVASNHDRIPRSSSVEAVEVPEKDIVKESQIADMESKIEEAKIRKMTEQVYPEGPQSLFLCHKFALISQLFLKHDNVMIMDDVYETLEILLKEHLKKLFEQLIFVAQARTSTYPDQNSSFHMIDDEIVNAALTFMPFPGRKDFVSSEYADVLYKVLDMHKPKTQKDEDLDIDTDNFYPFGSTELDSEYSQT